MESQVKLPMHTSRASSPYKQLTTPIHTRSMTYESLITHVNTLDKMNWDVRFTLDKLCGIWTDLVRRDDHWKNWGFNELNEAIPKWTERNHTERFERSGRPFKEQHQSEDIMHTHQNTKKSECIYCGSKDHKVIACNTIQDINKRQQIHQRWINVQTTFILNVHQHCFNIGIWLKMKVDLTYIYRRCFNVGKTLKQSWSSYVDPMLMT